MPLSNRDPWKIKASEVDADLAPLYCEHRDRWMAKLLSTGQGQTSGEPERLERDIRRAKRAKREVDFHLLSDAFVVASIDKARYLSRARRVALSLVKALPDRVHLQMLARVETALGRSKEAEALSRRASRAKDWHFDLPVYLGGAETALELGMKKEAMKFLADAVQMWPESGEAAALLDRAHSEPVPKEARRKRKRR
jgi:predicted Zn-dependent protease